MGKDREEARCLGWASIVGDRDTSERVDFDSATWTTPVGGVRERVVEDGSLRFRLVEFSQEFVEEGWCRRGHIGYMIDGELEIAFADHTIRLTAGDGLFIPGGEESKHRATSLTPVARAFLVDEADSGESKQASQST